MISIKSAVVFSIWRLRHSVQPLIQSITSRTTELVIDQNEIDIWLVYLFWAPLHSFNCSYCKCRPPLLKITLCATITQGVVGSGPWAGPGPHPRGRTRYSWHWGRGGGCETGRENRSSARSGPRPRLPEPGKEHVANKSERTCSKRTMWETGHFVKVHAVGKREGDSTESQDCPLRR